MDYRERKKLQVELEDIGYKSEMLDYWQPKIDLYWHKNGVSSTGGDVIRAKGSRLRNQPGDPATLAKLGRRGALSFPPSDTCVCKHCELESKENELPRDKSGKFVSSKTE